MWQAFATGIDSDIEDFGVKSKIKFKFDSDIAGGFEEKNSGIIQSSLGAAIYIFTYIIKGFSSSTTVH